MILNDASRKHIKNSLQLIQHDKIFLSQFETEKVSTACNYTLRENEIFVATKFLTTL